MEMNSKAKAQMAAAESARLELNLAPPPATVVSKYVVNVKEYGAVGNNLTNDAPAINAAYAAAAASGKPLYFPAGTYFVGTEQLRFLFNDILYVGISIYGDGPGRSIINAQKVAVSPQVLFTATNSPRGDNDYLVLKDLAILTNTAGTGVQFGARNYLDPINEPKIDITVINGSTAATARAVEINYVLNGDIRLDAKTAGPGTALYLRQASFNYFTGSYGTARGVSVRLSEGFNDGNVFSAPEMTNCSICVVSNSPYNQGNTFIGGLWSYNKNGIVSTAGARVMVLNPRLTPALPAKVSTFIGGAVGLTVIPATL